MNTTEIKTAASDKPARKSSAEVAGKFFRVFGKILFNIVKYTFRACLWVVKGILCLFGIVIGSAADTAEAEYRYDELGEYM
ncbi:MAG: hypothetical protein LUD47_02110 [Clostridia bacterium]|nr:hypothetical protein [Clostridia bacterium]